MRMRLVIVAVLTWAAYLFLYALKMSPWALEIVFVIVALIYWLARANPALRAVAICIPFMLALRRVGGPVTVLIGAALAAAFAFWSLE